MVRRHLPNPILGHGLKIILESRAGLNGVPHTPYLRVGLEFLKDGSAFCAEPNPRSRLQPRPRNQRGAAGFATLVATDFAGAKGGFSFGAPGSSSVGAVSGVSTLIWWSAASRSSGITLVKSSGDIPANACCINSIQIGSAARAPVSRFPSEICLSSKPTQTPLVICGVKPINHASV